MPSIETKKRYLLVLKEEMERSVLKDDVSTNMQCNIIIESFQNVNSAFDLDSMFTYHMHYNTVCTHIISGGKLLEESKSIPAFDYFCQHLETIPPELHQHYTRLITMLLQSLRSVEIHYQKETFYFNFLLYRIIDGKFSPVVSKIKIIKSDALNRPLLLSFQQVACQKLLYSAADKRLFTHYCTSLNIDFTKHNQLNRNLEVLLSKNEYQYAMDDYQEISSLPATSSNNCAKTKQKSTKKYSVGTRIAEKTTDSNYAQFKIAFNYLK